MKHRGTFSTSNNHKFLRNAMYEPRQGTLRQKERNECWHTFPTGDSYTHIIHRQYKRPGEEVGAQSECIQSDHRSESMQAGTDCPWLDPSC